MSAEAGASSVAAASPAAPFEHPPEGDAATAFLRRAQLAEDRLAEVLGAYRTLKRENDGHRERVTRNLERRYEGRRERLLMRFIEVLDNLDRALEAAETAFASEALVQGMILVRAQLLHLLNEEGLERIPVLGLPYDPHLSEAVETVSVSDPEQHQVVVKELLRGYRLNGRVARASRVVVAQYAQAGLDGDGAASTRALPPLGVDLRASTHSWRAPVAAPPEAELEHQPLSSADGPSLEEIIARAESLDRGDGQAIELAELDGDTDGALLDDDVDAVEEDERR